MAFRAARNRPGVEVVHVNEPKDGAATAAHLLPFDSVHGRWPPGARAEGAGVFRVNDGTAIRFTEASAPGEVPWEAGRPAGVNRPRVGGRRIVAVAAGGQRGSRGAG